MAVHRRGRRLRGEQLPGPELHEFNRLLRRAKQLVGRRLLSWKLISAYWGGSQGAHPAARGKVHLLAALLRRLFVLGLLRSQDFALFGPISQTGARLRVWRESESACRLAGLRDSGIQ